VKEKEVVEIASKTCIKQERPHRDGEAAVLPKSEFDDLLKDLLNTPLEERAKRWKLLTRPLTFQCWQRAEEALRKSGIEVPVGTMEPS
jgi:hypothetical protein